MLDKFTARFKKILALVKNKLTKTGNYKFKRGDIVYTNHGGLCIVDEVNTFGTYYDLKGLGRYYSYTTREGDLIKITKENLEISDIKYNGRYKYWGANLILVDDNGELINVVEQVEIKKGDTSESIINYHWGIYEKIRDDFINADIAPEASKTVTAEENLKIGDWILTGYKFGEDKRVDIGSIVKIPEGDVITIGGDVYLVDFYDSDGGFQNGYVSRNAAFKITREDIEIEIGEYWKAGDNNDEHRVSGYVEKGGYRYNFPGSYEIEKGMNEQDFINLVLQNFEEKAQKKFANRKAFRDETVGKEIELWGFATEQLDKDGFSFWINQDEKKVKGSLGDWAQIGYDEAEKMLRYIFKGYDVSVEDEIGKPDGYETIKYTDQLSKYVDKNVSAERISYDPAVNTTTSPERQRPYDWINVEDRNKNKQKTKRWDRQTMPDDSNGGYDQTNRFNDADKVSITPVASTDIRKTDSEIEGFDIILSPGDLVLLQYISDDGLYKFCRYEGIWSSNGRLLFKQYNSNVVFPYYTVGRQRHDRVSVNDIIKVSWDDVSIVNIVESPEGFFGVIEVEKDGRKYFENQYVKVDKSDNLDLLLEKAKQGFDKHLTTFAGITPVANADTGVRIGDIVFLDVLNELGFVETINHTTSRRFGMTVYVRTLRGNTRIVDEESLGVLHKFSKDDIELNIVRDGDKYFDVSPIVMGKNYYGILIRIEKVDTESSLKEKLFDELFKFLRTAYASAADSFVKKADEELKVGDLIISYSMAPFIGEVTIRDDKMFQAHMIFEGGGVNANVYHVNSLYEKLNRDDFEFDIVENNGKFFARPKIEKGDFKWFSSLSSFSVEIKKGMNQNDIIDELIKNIFGSKAKLGIMGGAYTKTADSNSKKEEE